MASIDLENEVSPAVVTGDGRANGTATTPCGDDGGTFGGKKASLMRIDNWSQLRAVWCSQRIPTSQIYHGHYEPEYRYRANRFQQIEIKKDLAPEYCWTWLSTNVRATWNETRGTRSVATNTLDLLNDFKQPKSLQSNS